MLTRRVFGLPVSRFTTPFDELDRMRQRMDQLFTGLHRSMPNLHRSGVYPALNVTEDRDKYRLRAELPGISAEDLDIQATGNTITLSGERRIPQVEEGVRYHRRERDGGSFSRAVNLPGDIDSERIEANLANGLLEVIIPKSEAARPRQITVN